jgi:hypothetical protein
MRVRKSPVVTTTGLSLVPHVRCRWGLTVEPPQPVVGRNKSSTIGKPLTRLDHMSATSVSCGFVSLRVASDHGVMIARFQSSGGTDCRARSSTESSYCFRRGTSSSPAAANRGDRDSGVTAGRLKGRRARLEFSGSRATSVTSQPDSTAVRWAGRNPGASAEVDPETLQQGEDEKDRPDLPIPDDKSPLSALDLH